MPDLYLVWRGTGNDRFLYGTRCSTSLPNFEQPQANLNNSGLHLNATGLSLAALPERILLIGTLGVSDSFLNLKFDSMCAASCQSWPSWTPFGPPDSGGEIPGRATSGTPGLAAWGTGALAVWVGVGDDTRVWSSQYNLAEDAWSSQYLTQLSGTGKPIQTGAGPAIVNFNGTLLMVWRGEGSNDSLYYASSHDGRTWTGNQQIAGAASTNAPAIVIFNGAPVLCFKSGVNDGGIYSTTYHVASDSWDPVVPTGPFGTTNGPTLAVYQGKLFMAWKGDTGDTGLWWSITSDNLNPKAWSGQANITGVGSEAGPAAVVY